MHSPVAIGTGLAVIPKWAGNVTLPKGKWLSISLVDADMNNPYQADLKIHGGSIVPTGKIVENTGENYLDPLTLYICLDDSGNAKGDLYEDDGDGFGYKSGDYALEHITATPNGSNETVKIASKEGNRAVPDREVVQPPGQPLPVDADHPWHGPSVPAPTFASRAPSVLPRTLEPARKHRRCAGTVGWGRKGLGTDEPASWRRPSTAPGWESSPHREVVGHRPVDKVRRSRVRVSAVD